MAEPSPQSERSTLPYTPSRAVFVGLQREMAELEAGLAEALDGRGRLVMLAGKPGIGKTRTAQQLGELAYRMLGTNSPGAGTDT